MSLAYLQQLVAETRKKGRFIEGSSDTTELAYLAKLVRDRSSSVKLVAEIGFNGGYSSYTFLEANPNCQVWSFDLGKYDHVLAAKQHIDEMFPGRHTLLLGNSMETVPRFQRDNPQMEFDLIFIDGGHQYKVARADLANMRELATENTILIIDDLVPWLPWGRGPTRAWREAQQRGLVVQEKLAGNKTINPIAVRRWAVGRYK